MFRQGTGHYLILKESTEKQDFNKPVFFNVHITINNARAIKKKKKGTEWISYRTIIKISTLCTLV